MKGGEDGMEIRHTAMKVEDRKRIMGGGESEEKGQKRADEVRKTEGRG